MPMEPPWSGLNLPRHAVIFLAIAMLLANVPAISCAADAATTRTIAMRGLVLPLYAQDPAFDYGIAVREIADLGANAVSLVVVGMQDNGRSTAIYRKDGRTVPDERLRRTIRQAREAGLAVTLLPIVLLENPGAEDWRGNIAPEPLDEWFASYRRWLLHYAAIAQEEGCAWMSVGSEFSSLEQHADHWRGTIAQVRGAFGGRLLYSCNWDHLDGPEQWWGELDGVGLSAYYELTEDRDAPQEELDRAWRVRRGEVLRWRERTAPHLPIVFTEVGYASMDGAAVYPWDYTLPNEPDVDEQKRCYQAFLAAWHDRPEVEGVFFFKWLTFDADDAKSYTPRGKPAEAVLRAWFAQ